MKLHYSHIRWWCYGYCFLLLLLTTIPQWLQVRSRPRWRKDSVSSLRWTEAMTCSSISALATVSSTRCRLVRLSLLTWAWARKAPRPRTSSWLPKASLCEQKNHPQGWFFRTQKHAEGILIFAPRGGARHQRGSAGGLLARTRLPTGRQVSFGSFCRSDKKNLECMFFSHRISMILSKFRDLAAEFVIDHRSIDTEANAKRIDDAIPTQSVATLHVALQ